MDMVERVARVIWTRRHGGDPEEAFRLYAAGKLRGDLRNVEIAFNLARAAIAAMREPDTTMLEAARQWDTPIRDMILVKPNPAELACNASA